MSQTEYSAEQINQMSFEEALSALETITRALEGGKMSLESAISQYEIGNALKEHCAKKLSEARLKIEKIVQKADGNLSSQEVNFAEQ